MAGVVRFDPAKGWFQQPNPTLDQMLMLLPPVVSPETLPFRPPISVSVVNKAG
jgi:hypothetical protein